ncbi:hypothetical protein C3L33_15210, partial [Rhododendron williamsianum]
MPYNSRYQEDYLYSFGVTLLEVLICNKRWGSFFDERKQSGVYWNLNYPDMPLKFNLDDVILSNTIYHLMDPHLAGKIGSECLREFLKITWSCLLQGFRSRTSINYVVRSLHCAVHLQENWQSLNASTAARTQSSSNEDISVNVYQEARNLSPEYDWTEGPFGPIFTLCKDPEIHFKYIKAAAKSGQIEEVERVTRESNFYDPEKTKNFLMKAKLRNARPLINVCDRFGFVPELTHYLYSNNMLSYIEGYAEKLLDDDCPEDFIKGFILSVCSLLKIEPQVEELEKRQNNDVPQQSSLRDFRQSENSYRVMDPPRK